jgi:hypothetical protein
VIVMALGVMAVAGSASAHDTSSRDDSARAASARGAPASAAARPRAALRAVRLTTRRGRPLPGRWQSWADAALVPTVRGRVVVRVARCPARRSAAGCVYTRRPRTIWLRPGLRDPRGVMLHELGHVYDLLVMNNRDRGRFRRIVAGRGARRPWWRGSEPLAEQFAEAYSWCARFARIVSIRRYSSYSYRPSGRQHRRICAVITRAAGDRAPAVPPLAVPPVTGPHPLPPAPPSSAPGVVPGDPKNDPGPQKPEDPDEPEREDRDEPEPEPAPAPLPVPTTTPSPLPTPPPLPVGPPG